EGGLAVVHELAQSLDGAETIEDVARRLVEWGTQAIAIEFGALLLVDDEQREARGVVLHAHGAEADWFGSARIDLIDGPSGVARVRSSSALAVALERERLVARITSKFRTELDLDSVLRVAVEEAALALGASRAFIRLGGRSSEMPVAAEWHPADVEPIGSTASS